MPRVLPDVPSLCQVGIPPAARFAFGFVVLSWCGCSAKSPTGSADPPAAVATPEPAVAPGAEAASPASPASAPAEKLAPGEVARANRLGRETSPYLRLHAHNPVDWYPWGEDAFALAREQNKLIFLSVGYSSCHWCHVMERESFRDAEIAAFLNEHFVCVKVDREERPDVDTIYMTAVQIVTRRGGWPMSVFLLPDGRPLYGGTYFPARDGERGASTGFLTLVQKLHEAWSAHPDELGQDAERLTGMVKTALDRQRPPKSETLTPGLLNDVQDALAEQFDERHGGFGHDLENPRRPKFPEASNLYFLLYRARDERLVETRRDAARRMLVGTLDGLLTGGIHDHLGGGFHRYSVDRYWGIPHFEKMLYDNGQLATIYAEAFALTGRADYRRAAADLAEFVLREWTDPAGGFHAALDADSEDEEGRFYRWDLAEARQLLGDGFPLFAAIYSFDGEPNFDEHFFVPRLSRPLGELAAKRDTTEERLEAQLAPLRRLLFEARAKRPRPLTDTKVLTSWNGLMIRGLADTGRVLETPRYIQAAERAATFVLEKLRTPEGRLLRTYGEGEAKLNGYLDDYAFLVDGLLALHRATRNARWLQAADELTAKQIELFWDDRHGGFFFTSDDHESLLARVRKVTDEAIPSGNSVAAENLIQLHLAHDLARPAYVEKARRTLVSLAGTLEALPSAAPRAAVAVGKLLDRLPSEK